MDRSRELRNMMKQQTTKSSVANAKDMVKQLKLQKQQALAATQPAVSESSKLSKAAVSVSVHANKATFVTPTPYVSQATPT
ncbi:hypothetical protein EON63_22830, partial [archaeon]